MAKRKKKSPGPASTSEAVVDRPATDSAVAAADSAVPRASTPGALAAAVSTCDATRLPMTGRTDAELADGFCDNCGRSTPQEVFDSGHERDSSGDWQRCLRCGWERFGLTGKWEPPTPDSAPPADSNADGAAHPLTPSPRHPVTISVPLGPPIEPGEEGTCPRHVDVQLRNARQRATMRRLFAGLDLAGERTLDGKRVDTYARAVLWLLEQIEGRLVSDE